MTGVCFCTRIARYGYSPGLTASSIWACTPAHLEFMRKAKEPQMADIETKARNEAGRVACEYLAEVIHETDLIKVTPEQLDIFLQAVIETFRDELKRLAVPF